MEPITQNTNRIKLETCTQEQTKTIQNHYDFGKAIEFINQKGKEFYGKHFKIHPSDYEILFKLLVYFIGDKTNAEKHGINLQKGILLSGPVGCGKTSLMTLLRFLQHPSQRYIVKSCRDVSFEFIRNGYQVVDNYGRLSLKKENPTVYCFDDLGIENNLKYYGNECNVMAEVLLSRYDLFVSRKLITHITTNLNSSEIEAIYGNRVRSRLREMFNLIAFGKDVEDKRV